MKKIIFIFFLFPVSLVFAQQFNISNQKTLGGNDDDELSSIIITPDNKFLLGGTTRSPISGDKTVDLFTNPDFDGWLIKTDSTFHIEWQLELGGTGVEIFRKIVLTPDSSYLCLFTSMSTISGIKTVDTIGAYDVWIVKVDKNGNLLWQGEYGGTGNDQISDAILTNDGGVIVACYSTSDSSGTKTENSKGLSDYWIFKIDALGNQLWDKTIGGNSFETLYSITTDGMGNIYLTGKSSSGISGDKTEPNMGDSDGWIVKLDSSRNVIWDRALGGDLLDNMSDVLLFGNSIYLLGYSFSGISGNKTDTCRGLSDYWVVKLNQDGQIIWDKTIGGNNYDNSVEIRLNNLQQLILSGYSASGISGEKTEITNGGYDMWMIGLDTLGNILWQKDIGGNSEEIFTQFEEIYPNNYILSGYSRSGVSGDKDEPCRGNRDFWIIELSTTVGINNLNHDNQIAVYPNPTTEDITLVLPMESKNRTITFFNGQGILVKKETVSGQLNHISIRNLPAGLYFYRITENDKLLQAGKIVKQ